MLLFVPFFTASNYDKLLFIGPRGPGFMFYSLWDGGERVHLDFFSFIFWTVEGEGRGWRLMFLFPPSLEMWKEEGGKGLI